MKVIRTMLIGFMLGAGGLVAPAYAVVPQVVAYQGQLQDAAGTPVNGVVNITFTLYTTPTGVSSVWSETQIGVNISKGLFEVDLGSVISFPFGTFNTPVYLGVTVGTDPEMTPRTLLTSAPYALHADDADTVGGFTPAQLQGATGPTGPQGPAGPAGSPDTGAQILTKLAPVDGAASGLDADLLDGKHAASFATAVHTHGLDQGGTGATTAAGALANLGAAASGANSDITSMTGLTTPLSLGQGGTGSTTGAGAFLNIVLANDGFGSTLDADALDGLDSASFLRSDANGSWSNTLGMGTLSLGDPDDTVAVGGHLTVTGSASFGTGSGPQAMVFGSAATDTNTFNGTTTFNDTVVAAWGAASERMTLSNASAGVGSYLLTVQSIGAGGSFARGIVVAGTGTSTITTGLDVSSTGLTNAIDLGGNAVLGTNFSVTAGGAITSTSLTDGTATLAGGALTGLTGAVTTTGTVTGGSLTDGTATLTAGGLSGLTNVSLPVLSTAPPCVGAADRGRLYVKNNTPVADSVCVCVDIGAATFVFVDLVAGGGC